jgi:hypothetical protein
MARVDLRVPYSEKDEAKGLGARWDAELRLWFVPDGTNPAPFARWLAPAFSPNLRSSSYFIARSDRSCWKCFMPTRVFAFLLPAGFEALEPDEDENEVWRQKDQPLFITYLTAIPEAASQHIVSLSPHYRLDFSKTVGHFYWMNHCEKCNAALGDFDTMEDGPFSPHTADDARSIFLYPVEQAFEAEGTILEWVLFTGDGMWTLEDFVPLMQLERAGDAP